VHASTGNCLFPLLVNSDFFCQWFYWSFRRKGFRCHRTSSHFGAHQSFCTTRHMYAEAFPSVKPTIRWRLLPCRLCHPAGRQDTLSSSLCLLPFRRLSSPYRSRTPVFRGLTRLRVDPLTPHTSIGSLDLWHWPTPTTSTCPCTGFLAPSHWILFTRISWLRYRSLVVLWYFVFHLRLPCHCFLRVLCAKFALPWPCRRSQVRSTWVDIGYWHSVKTVCWLCSEFSNWTS